MSDVGCSAGDAARERYADSRNCAQGVIGALAEMPGVPTLPESLGAGFSGGIGRSGCVCGALVGGVEVLGEWAKTAGLEPAATRLLAEELSAELYGRFTQRFGTSCCRIIKRGQTDGTDAWLSECADLTEWTAATVAEIVAEHAAAEDRSRWAFRDTVSLARRGSLGVLAAGAIALLASVIAPPDARDVVFAGVLAVLSVTAVASETGGPWARRVGRVVRVAGVVAAAVVGLALLAGVGNGAPRVAALLGAGSAWLVGARAVLGIALVVAAGTALFGLKRYR